MNNFKAYSHPRISPNSVTSISDLVYYGRDNSRNKLVEKTNNISRYEIAVGDYVYEYDFNQYGFRGNWNIDPNKSNIGFFGCSFTFGEYVESNKIFPTLVSEKIGSNGFNFGLSAASIERIAQTFAAANRVIDLEYAVVTLPDWNRMLYLNNDSNGIRYLDLIHTDNHNTEVDSFKRIMYGLDNDYFIHQAIRNINWIIDVAEKHSVKLLLASWENYTSQLVNKVFPSYSIGRYEVHDHSMDQIHPGTVSNATYAEKIVEHLHKK